MSVVRRILLVDDEADLRDALAEQLQVHDSFETEVAGDGADALEKAKNGRFDAILLDVGLPDMDGREVCKALRRSGVACPVIMLTAMDGDADTILGLDSGANDYVAKPFKLPVLLARLRAHLRQHEASEDAVFTVNRFVFRPGAKLLVDEAANRKVHLTDKETSILRYLYRAGRRPVSRETLLNEVWGYNPGVTTHTLETHIYRLRQKIEADPSNAEILVTEPGGYKLQP